MEPFSGYKVEPLENNTRYILELERNVLLQEKYGFDIKYGTFSFAFLTSLEAFALLAYVYIATVLIYYKETRTKTNFIVSVWAIINFTVLLEKLSRGFLTEVPVGDGILIRGDVAWMSEMIAGIGRFYATSLSAVWLFSKYFGSPKPKYNGFMYFLISIPALVCVAYIYHFYAVDKFIYEVYGPACDVVNAVVYMAVGILFIFCKICGTGDRNKSQYALIISLLSLITNFPLSLMTIYLRFNLDVKWQYTFHIYFVDIIVNALSFCNAFGVLFIVMLYNEKVRQQCFVKAKQDVEDQPEVISKGDVLEDQPEFIKMI